MKKISLVALAILLCCSLALTACGNSGAESDAEATSASNEPIASGEQEKVNENTSMGEGWLLADELSYTGLVPLVSSIDDMKARLGEPDCYEKVSDPVVEYFHLYRYGDVEFYCHPDTPDRISQITIVGPDSQPICRDICYGDSFDDVLTKFPQERDYKQDADHIFYGDILLYGPGGGVYDYINGEGDTCKTISLTTETIWPFLKIQFDPDDLIDRIIIFGESWT